MTEMIKTILNGEFEIVIPKHRADRPEWHSEAGWEKLRLKSMNEHIGKKDVVYYVGAEEGEFPALCQTFGFGSKRTTSAPHIWHNAGNSPSSAPT